MLKTGIWRPSQIHSSTLFRRKNRPISYRLLKGADAGDPSTIRLFESIVRDLQLSSGICRTTYPGRFADVDELASPFIVETPGSPSLNAHDWAASDCMASTEWARELWKHRPEARLVASDLMLNLFEVSRRDTSETLIFEPDGALVQYVRPPFVIGMRGRISVFYPVNRYFAARARRLAPKALDVLRLSRAGEPDSRGQAVPASWNVEPLSLIHPYAHDLARRDPRFAIRPHSIFSPLPDACHVIRTMNIFNHGYFDEHTLVRGIRTVLASLVEGGVWIVGRTTEETQPPRNCASIFRKCGGRFEVLSRMNGGSEIEGLIGQLHDAARNALS